MSARIKTLVFLMLIAMLATACASATPAPTEEPAAPVTTEAPAAPAEPFRVAVIMPSAINDLAFSQSMIDAVKIIQSEMGGEAGFQFVFSENMFVVDDAAAAIRDYASQGYDLVIAHGSQYGSSLREIAPDFPEVSFAHGTTVDTFVDEGIKNVFAYEAASNQGGYVQGVMAAMLSKSNVIGVIGMLAIWLLERSRCYDHRYSWKLMSVIPEVASWVIFAVVTLVLAGLPVIQAQTMLLFGDSLTYERTPKGILSKSDRSH